MLQVSSDRSIMTLVGKPIVKDGSEIGDEMRIEVNGIDLVESIKNLKWNNDDVIEIVVYVNFNS